MIMGWSMIMWKVSDRQRLLQWLWDDDGMIDNDVKSFRPSEISALGGVTSDNEWVIMKTILKKDSDDDGISFWPLEISALGGVTTTNPALSPGGFERCDKTWDRGDWWWYHVAFVDSEDFVVDADVDDDD